MTVAGAPNNSRTITTLVTQRTMLVTTILCIVAFVALSAVSTVLGSEPLKNAILGLVSAILGIAVVGLLWEVGTKRAFTAELQLQFAALVESVVRQAAIAAVAEREGLVDLTRDFHSGIPFRSHISHADSIDLCWWAGRNWIEQHLPDLQQALSRQLKIRVILPDVENADTLRGMALDSGLSEQRLYQSTREAIELLETLPSDGVEVRLSARAPRYMFMRLGDSVVFSTYPLTPGKNVSRPNMICSRSGPVGAAASAEFNEFFNSLS